MGAGRGVGLDQEMGSRSGTSPWEGKQTAARGRGRGVSPKWEEPEAGIRMQGTWPPSPGPALSFTKVVQPDCLARKFGHLS